MGRKATLVHCCGSFLPLLSRVPNGACVLFVMKSVPVGFPNRNPCRPINKCSVAHRRNMSRSFAMRTWTLQATRGLGRLWEIAVSLPVDV